VRDLEEPPLSRGEGGKCVPGVAGERGELLAVRAGEGGNLRLVEESEVVVEEGERSWVVMGME